MSKDEFESAFNRICCICTDSIMEGEVKHKITDKDDFKWTICDSCWNKLKTIMDQEE